MALRTDSFDLGRLGLSSGEARRLELHVPLAGFSYGGQDYGIVPHLAPVRLDVSRMTGGGHSLRLRFTARVTGPCVRCLEPADPEFVVDVHEVDQPGGGEELASDYVSDAVLDVAAWARDAFLLSLPAQITCRPECAGLCPVCGIDLNAAEPGHGHASEPDSRWAKLRELRFD